MFRTIMACVAATLVAISLPSLSYSAGTEQPATEKCAKGYVMDANTKKCVKKTSANVPDKAITDQAWQWAYAGDYEYAIELFKEVAAKGDPEALNGMGYAHRKLGKTQEAIAYYEKALAIDPDYLLARNYLAKGYLASGNMEPALQQLAEIGKRCKAPCKLYHDLKAVIVLADNGIASAY